MNLKLNHAVFASGRGTAMMQHCRYTPGLQLILQLSVRMVVGVVNRIIDRSVLLSWSQFWWEIFIKIYDIMLPTVFLRALKG